MPTYPTDYYNRFDETKNFETHVFRAGKVLQSAELNEVQSNVLTKIKGISDVLFKDGDIYKNARIIVNETTGVTTCESGVIYLKGSMRGVPPKTMTIPIVGTVVVGVRLQQSVVDEIADVTLRDPAVSVRNYQEPGASRLVMNLVWSYDGDGLDGDFYPVYTVVDGIVLSKELPPSIDAISSAIAAYDRQSTGGTYVISGLTVTELPDVGGNQVYSVEEGDARINGQHVIVGTSIRTTYAATPDLRTNISEPHTSTGPSNQVITLDRTPITQIDNISITTEVLETVTRGLVAGTSDLLAHGSVVSITSVVQGATTYTPTTDYTLTTGSVDWSAGGIEPATGSTYQVTYRYITNVSPVTHTADTVTVAGGVSGTLVLVSYKSALPRYDRLCLSKSGMITWVKGIATDFNQVVPSVPSGMIGLATILQNWRTTGRIVTDDSIRMMTMAQINALKGNIIDLYDLVAENQLKIDSSSREAVAKRGLFVDAFRNNNQRDAGITQNLISVNNELELNIVEQVVDTSLANTSPVTMASTNGYSLIQETRTGTMKINPYMAFDPIPARVKLVPDADRAVTVNEIWSSAVIIRTQWRFSFLDDRRERTKVLSDELVVSNTNLRQIQVNFEIKGFGAGENLTSVTFDGIDVTSTVA